MLKKWLPYLRKAFFLLGLILLLVLLFWLKQRQRSEVCADIHIEIVVPLDKQMLTEYKVMDLLSEWYPGGLVGIPASQIDLHDIEMRIAELPVVSAVEVSYQMNGILEIDIDQRIPIVRIYHDENNSYYLDYQGGNIPADGLESARVPVASGWLTPDMIKKVYTLSAYVQENQFAEALVEQIFVTSDGGFILVPKIGSHQIILGEPTALENKFHRLEKFYKQGLNQVGWDKYKTIDLTYANQIVCK